MSKREVGNIGKHTGARGVKTAVGVEGATLLFQCGVGGVASRLLSKLVGLYHQVIHLGGP